MPDPSRPLLTLAWSVLASRLGDIRLPDLSATAPGEVELLVCVQGDDPRPEIPAALHGARVIAVPGVGVARSRNVALEHARGRYLLFCDDDIEIRLDSAMACVRHLQRTGRALALGTAVTPSGAPRKRYPTTTRRLTLLNTAKAATYEMVLDLDAARAAAVRFDERFGAGAALPLGDEYIFIADLLRAGLRGDAVPWVLATHPDDSSGHRWGTDEDARHRAIVLNRVFERLAPIARVAFALRNGGRWGSLRRAATFVACSEQPDGEMLQALDRR